MQAAIKKKFDKQKKRNSLQGDAQTAAPQPARHQKPGQTAPATAAAAAAAEDREELEDTLEEMMEGPQRREKEREEVDHVDLLPIVDSVFGQVRAACCSVMGS